MFYFKAQTYVRRECGENAVKHFARLHFERDGASDKNETYIEVARIAVHAFIILRKSQNTNQH